MKSIRQFFNNIYWIYIYAMVNMHPAMAVAIIALQAVLIVGLGYLFGKYIIRALFDVLFYALFNGTV